MSVSVEMYHGSVNFVDAMCFGIPNTNHKGHRVAWEHIYALNTGHVPITEDKLIPIFELARQHDEITDQTHHIRVVWQRTDHAVPGETR